MAKTINLEFEGYYTEDELPLLVDHQCAGVYAVYRGKENEEENEEDLRELLLTQLLYIGRSSDISERLSPDHHRYNDWRQSLKKDEQLYFCIAYTEDEERAEAALIYKVKPRLNRSGTDGFHYKETTIETSGCNYCLEGPFIAYPTEGD